MTSVMPPFTPDVVAAVTAHMNSDHPEDNLLIATANGGPATATEARLVSVDAGGALFEAVGPEGATAVAVPWAGPVTERAHIRHEVVRMYQEACVTLGVEPRGEGEH